MEKITTATYIKSIKEGGSVAVLFGSRCGRCIKARGVMKKVSPEIKTFYCDIEKERHLFYMLGILYVPTVILYKNGEYIGRITGEITKEKVEEYYGKKA